MAVHPCFEPDNPARMQASSQVCREFLLFMANELQAVVVLCRCYQLDQMQQAVSLSIAPALPVLRALGVGESVDNCWVRLSCRQRKKQKRSTFSMV